jgi:hypothetical protein
MIRQRSKSSAVRSVSLAGGKSASGKSASRKSASRKSASGKSASGKTASGVAKRSKGVAKGVAKVVRRIDFSKIKWGKFTAMFAAYRRRHPHTRITNLDQFSRFILAHPNRFDLKAKRRAQFYRNIILKRK